MISDNVSGAISHGYVGRIPVRNLWLLMLYASELLRVKHVQKIDIEDNPDDIPDLIAELLTYEVERRLKRNLSFGYLQRQAALGRVRGQIDLLDTECHQLLSRGLVACRFEDLTINTPRNRFVRAALYSISRIVNRPELAHRCRSISNSLKHLGVSGEMPTRHELSLDRIGRNDSHDQFMITAAKLAFDLALPTESEGLQHMEIPDREITWIRRLYEKAVGGFYRVVLQSQGWHIETSKFINWAIELKTSGIDQILPAMQTDIVLENQFFNRRIVIDTKFNSVVTQGRFREEVLRSSYIYQIYAYLRSQENLIDPLSEHATGILLHPSVGQMIDETVVIQGHTIRFATVDLTASVKDIRKQLLKMIELPSDLLQTPGKASAL
jgi:5-methylcytosine-specific restriction enzyme subunit McrC